MSQIVAFNIALHSLTWTQWEPSVLVCMGDGPNTGVFKKWLPHLRDVTFMFPPVSDTENIPFYYAQIDGLFRWAPVDADVLVRMDADTLPVANFEDVLDYVVDTASIAGVMAHFGFPARPGMSATPDTWRRAAKGLITAPLEFIYTYSLASTDVPEQNRVAPFYLNDGVVFFPKSLFRDFAELYLKLRPKVMDRLAYPYFAGQVTLAFVVTEMHARTCALPMRYNFPNDELARRKFPEELETVTIFHYLRTDEFDRQLIFTNAGNYQQFLNTQLTGSNKAFRQAVLKVIGPELPL